MHGRVAATIAASEGIPTTKADFVLEGGSVHTDGEGCAAQLCASVSTFLNTVKFQLSDFRLPMSPFPLRHELESAQILAAIFGCQK